MLSWLILKRKQKVCSNASRIRIFLLRSYSFGIETKNTFIHSRTYPIVAPVSLNQNFRGLKRRYSAESRGGGGGVRSAWMKGKENAVFSLSIFSHVSYKNTNFNP